MSYSQKYFQVKELFINNKKLKYYLSPTLLKHNFKHGFFTKTSSEINLSLLSNNLSLNNRICILNQIHSNQIVFGSKTKGKGKVKGDGIVCDKHNQNLFIYTADCMPILFADKKKRIVAAIHCGRKGLENKIIKNLIKIFYNKGCLKEDILVAIGPSISQKNYLLDNKTLIDFFTTVACKESISFSKDKKILLSLKKLAKLENQNSTLLDLKKYAYIQLLDENISTTNIDVSNLCTYESNHDFHSWRRSKTYSRQWNYISS